MLGTHKFQSAFRPLYICAQSFSGRALAAPRRIARLHATPSAPGMQTRCYCLHALAARHDACRQRQAHLDEPGVKAQLHGVVGVAGHHKAIVHEQKVVAQVAIGQQHRLARGQVPRRMTGASEGRGAWRTVWACQRPSRHAALDKERPALERSNIAAAREGCRHRSDGEAMPQSSHARPCPPKRPALARPSPGGHHLQAAAGRRRNLAIGAEGVVGHVCNRKHITHLSTY